MLVWRICKARHAASPLGGEGARLYGGRWNHKGFRMVYTAASQSLATLEALVHLEVGDTPGDYRAVSVDLPDDLPQRVLTPGELPADWRQVPGPGSLKDLGTDWLRSGKEAVLRVPSAIIPDEWNVLLNPDHPDAARFRPGVPTAFIFDPRLLD